MRCYRDQYGWYPQTSGGIERRGGVLLSGGDAELAGPFPGRPRALALWRRSGYLPDWRPWILDYTTWGADGRHAATSERLAQGAADPDRLPSREGFLHGLLPPVPATLAPGSPKGDPEDTDPQGWFTWDPGRGWLCEARVLAGPATSPFPGVAGNGARLLLRAFPELGTPGALERAGFLSAARARLAAPAPEAAWAGALGYAPGPGR